MVDYVGFDRGTYMFVVGEVPKGWLNSKRAQWVLDDAAYDAWFNKYCPQIAEFLEKIPGKYARQVLLMSNERKTTVFPPANFKMCIKIYRAKDAADFRMRFC